MTEDVIPINPVKVGEVTTSYEEVVPMYLIGYIGGDPVYRTTTCWAGGKNTFLWLNITKIVLIF